MYNHITRLLDSIVGVKRLSSIHSAHCAEDLVLVILTNFRGGLHNNGIKSRAQTHLARKLICMVKRKIGTVRAILHRGQDLPNRKDSILKGCEELALGEA